ncbi:MAG TPA: 5-formyltetrahydrofolate cyclo-ligase [Anaerolineae bacterium]|nr:5-formyltetrahydrofolate cyclo-ligase [Anaerolineae bacterium]
MDKLAVREAVWRALDQVAVPDSRFHRDYTMFIPDFAGSDQAVAQLTAHPYYRQAATLFITPDNCLEKLRWQTLRDGKKLIVTTEAGLRGLFLLDPAQIKPEDYRYAACLDGQERMGRPISLREIQATLNQLDLLVTGASVVNAQGIRFGKGHGYFDVEWAVFYAAGLVKQTTPVFAVVHDCQVAEIELEPDEYDTVMDAIFTPTRTLEIASAQKPTTGVIWEKLKPGRSQENLVLRELRQWPR